MPASGLMRHPVSLERSTTTVDSVGQAVKSWRVVERFWARVEVQSNNETLIGQQTGSYTQYEITTRKTRALVGQNTPWGTSDRNRFREGNEIRPGP